MKHTLLLLLWCMGALAFLRQGQRPEYDTDVDQLIVQWKETQSGTDVQTNSEKVGMLAAQSGLGMRLMLQTESGSVVKLNQRYAVASLQETIKTLASNPLVESVEVDVKMFPQVVPVVPTDPEYSRQWHYKQNVVPKYGMNLENAWSLATGDSSVVVAVVDTGILNHPDLTVNLVSGYDMIADLKTANDGNARDPDASDPGDWDVTTNSDSSWHGTHCAGTIAARTNNGIGGAGVCWNCKVMPMRFLGVGGGYTSDMAAAILWAVGVQVSTLPLNTKIAKVISISAGGGGACSSTLQSAINTAISRGATIVVAAGNDGADASSQSPANCIGVITVAAHGPTGRLASYSNYGSVVDIAAPGGDSSYYVSDGIYGVISTINTGTQGPVTGGWTYAEYEGTSMATPHVSGLVGLMLSMDPTLTPAKVLSYITSNAVPMPIPCGSTTCGYGMVDAYKTLLAIYNAKPKPILMSPSPAKPNPIPVPAGRSPSPGRLPNPSPNCPAVQNKFPSTTWVNDMTPCKNPTAILNLLNGYGCSVYSGDCQVISCSQALSPSVKSQLAALTC